MRYQILGPLTIADNDKICTPSATKVKILLSLLLVRGNEIVPKSQLIREIWGDDPPRRADASLHVYVSQLRRVLTCHHGRDSPLITANPGYMLRTNPEELDFQYFQELRKSGNRSYDSRLHADAAEDFRVALDLWHGEVLSDVPFGPVLTGTAVQLEEARVATIELYNEAQLALGNHTKIIGNLRALVTENPFREAFHRQLMLALYRSERRAEALEVYQRTRATLRDELGLEPSHKLQRLQQAVLTEGGEYDLVPENFGASERALEINLL